MNVHLSNLRDNYEGIALSRTVLSADAIGNPYGAVGYGIGDAPVGCKYSIRHRVLDAALNAWQQRDPLEHKNGPYLYWYASSNPIQGSDPPGLEVIPASYLPPLTRHPQNPPTPPPPTAPPSPKPGLSWDAVDQAATQFAGGTLCLASPIRRSPVVFSNGSPPPALDCSGEFILGMNTFAANSPGSALGVPGTAVNCQWYGRDPGFAAPLNVQLTNAVEYTVNP